MASAEAGLVLASGLSIGEELKRARETAGLSVSEMARRAETSRSAVHAYETGGREPSVTTALRLLRTCDCSLNVVSDRDLTHGK